MSTLSVNPLSKHFRQPALYIKLPSEGRWYNEGALDMPITGEVPIYAMTARDEITMKTPDALMNGASTIHVIESCCPAIKNAWKMPIIDLDAILVAVRLATYGKEMEFTAQCPHCKETIEKAIDLTVLLSKIGPANWSQPIKTDTLEITLKPQNYEEYNKNNLLNYEQQRLMQIVQNEELSEDERVRQFDEMFQKVIEIGINQVGKNIQSIKLDDGTIVDNSEFIFEFLDNCDRTIWDAIKSRLEEIRAQSEYNNIKLTCTSEECGKEFTTPFVFEQSNFFV